MLKCYARPMAQPSVPQWLDHEEADAWSALVAVLSTLPAALDAQLQRDDGMTFYEYQVLAALFDATGRAERLSDLAASTNGSMPRLSQVVTKLERRGWVRRRPDPADGRCTLAVLTDAGRDRLVAAAPGHVEAVRRLVFDPLSRAQVRQLAAVHRRIGARTALVGAPGPPELATAGRPGASATAGRGPAR